MVFLRKKIKDGKLYWYGQHNFRKGNRVLSKCFYICPDSKGFDKSSVLSVINNSKKKIEDENKELHPDKLIEKLKESLAHVDFSKKVEVVKSVGVGTTSKEEEVVKSAVNDLKEKDEKLLKGRRSDEFQDIGEKFGGAKKDYFSEKRQLEAEDLDELEKNKADAIKFITKDKCVSPINDEEEIASGTTVSALYLKKLLYDSLGVKPIIDSKEAREFFLKHSQYVFDSLKDVKTVEDFLKFQEKHGDYLRKNNVYSDYLKDVMGSRFANFMFRKGTNFKEKFYKAKELEKNSVGLSDMLKLFEKKQAERKKRSTFKKEILTNITRDGGRAIRNTDPKRIIEQLGLRGVEYGNWLNDDDAKKNVKYFIGSMYDLQDVTGLDIIGLNQAGKLGIAFGSRGSGSALAHYEPARDVINLTKNKGDGSLAHEWGHYFDKLMKKNYGDPNQKNINKQFMSHDADNVGTTTPTQKAFKDVMDIMIKGDSAVEMDIQASKRYIPSYSLKNAYNEAKNDGKSLQQFYDGYMEKEKERVTRNIENLKKWNYDNPTITRYSKRYEDEYYKKAKEVAQLLPHLESKEEIKLKVPTDKSEYYMNSSKQGSTYWTSPHEMFARAFESYVQDTLAEKKMKNNYLVDGTLRTASHSKEGFPYPQGNERKKINNKIKKFLEVFNDEFKNGVGTTNKNNSSLPKHLQQTANKINQANKSFKTEVFERNGKWHYRAIDKDSGIVEVGGFAKTQQEAEKEIEKYK